VDSGDDENNLRYEAIFPAGLFTGEVDVLITVEDAVDDGADKDEVFVDVFRHAILGVNFVQDTSRTSVSLGLKLTTRLLPSTLVSLSSLLLTVEGELKLSIKFLPLRTSELLRPPSLLPGVYSGGGDNNGDDLFAEYPESRLISGDLSVDVIAVEGSLRSEAHRLASTSSSKIIVLACCFFFFFFTLVNGFCVCVDFVSGSCDGSCRNDGNGVFADN
jgi:hypothetical protein